eukprot:6444582-Alexandrium_andersonii.AAC.1
MWSCSVFGCDHCQCQCRVAMHVDSLDSPLSLCEGPLAIEDGNIDAGSAAFVSVAGSWAVAPSAPSARGDSTPSAAAPTKRNILYRTSSTSSSSSSAQKVLKFSSEVMCSGNHAGEDQGQEGDGAADA